MNGLPRPSAFNLPYGVSLSDLEPDEPHRSEPDDDRAERYEREQIEKERSEP